MDQLQMTKLAHQRQHRLLRQLLHQKLAMKRQLPKPSFLKKCLLLGAFSFDPSLQSIGRSSILFEIWHKKPLSFDSMK